MLAEQPATLHIDQVRVLCKYLHPIAPLIVIYDSGGAAAVI